MERSETVEKTSPSTTDMKLTDSSPERHIAAKKNFSALEIVALGFNVTNSWLSIATSFAVVVAAGGPVTLMYGLIIVFVVYGCVAASLAEMASVYPTAGGQYHYAALVAPSSIARVYSYTCGSIATCSWIAGSCGATILGAEILLVFPITFVEGYVPKSWHYFLVYEALMVMFLIWNVFIFRRTLWLQDVAFGLSVVTFLAITIYVLVVSPKQPSAYVWKDLQDNTGWSDGICFITGLVTPAFMYTALDAPLHMAEICTEPKKTVPRAMMTTVLIGFISAFMFSIAMCYGIVDLDAMLNTTMPIYTLWRQATANTAGPTVILAAMFCVILVAIYSIQQAAGQMIMSLGRDDTLFLSRYLGHVHPTLQVPVWALTANTLCGMILGCLYVASSEAFNALINSLIILQIVSFAMPCLAVMLSGRREHVLPEDRHFKIPAGLGWICNSIAVAFALVELIFFSFPVTIPTSASSMNYTSAIIGVMGVFVLANWFGHARKHYIGPIIEL